ncbi:2,4-dienoyl-CoA reductase-like NADH-dependent reductase (Old Yellow Enzyme family) [Pedobacter cryoconitis]|uniref:2,4-dienoyl-CoA reductase-like NADH-dependent reductase (Old Yellow Enzyme family) n=1 Tax=Pedobacter cryoconitis TaxID=188932 RepID=A0A7W8YU55_9SPHI|nr:NADH:flavin oxidoreductase [Pedobacter cryoconitis]MBB5621852.1 2,4-dienoyl-CoA reductase-like NADH-dependent reductase (Old Yellow Enzyme family) [Pedobacter cryoconitis]
MNTESLFRPFRLKSLNTRNRFVMSPMTRSFSPAGIPTADVANYYRKRAEGEVGLIISEGTIIDRPSAGNEPDVPDFYKDESLAGWQQVIDGVLQAGGQMAPQLWHIGIQENHHSGWLPPAPFEGPSTRGNGKAMTDSDIADTITAFGCAAAHAKRMGFNSVEIQGAHGYLIDQFFWENTNKRSDFFGGKTLAERSRFAIEVTKEVRQKVGEDFALMIRLSQWRFSDFHSKLAKNPQELASWLTPLADAGIDIFHCSTRRFWEPEFAGSNLNLAGWAKKLTGKATITVGSVGLDNDVTTIFTGENSSPTSIDELIRRMDTNEFDLVAVGRSILADPYWVQKVKEDRMNEFQGFNKEALNSLV